MTKNFIFSFLSLLLISCSDSAKITEMPKDFDFDFKYGILEEYEVNTFNNTFKKALTWEKETVVKLNLSTFTKRKIYDKFIQILHIPIP